MGGVPPFGTKTFTTKRRLPEGMHTPKICPHRSYFEFQIKKGEEVYLVADEAVASATIKAC